MQKTNIVVGTAMACGFMAGCGPAPATLSPTFDSRQASGQVHYEAVNDQGEFTEHQELQDPLTKDYASGVWRASRKSEVTTQATSSSGGNRVNIVFVGDGYTQAQMSDYANDASGIQAKFLAQAPFKAYATYFSFHRVNVVSKDAGVSKAIAQESKNTALGMTYDCDGVERLLCIDSARRWRRRTTRRPSTRFSRWRIRRRRRRGLLVAAGFDVCRQERGLDRISPPRVWSLVRKTNRMSTTPPEFSIAARRSETASVNAASMKASKSKWYRWLGTQGVDAFQGSCYSMSYYRPHLNSRMRALGTPYGAVNVEQLILKIYDRGNRSTPRRRHH